MATVVAAALTVLGSASGAPEASGQAWRCADDALTTTVTQSSAVRVYYRTSDELHKLFACSRRTGNYLRELDFPEDGLKAFRYPAIQASGYMVGVGTEFATDERQPGGSGVAVFDLRLPATAPSIVGAGAGPLRFAKVTDLVVRPSSAAAWISCAGARGFTYGDPGRACRRPGRLMWVYRVGPREKERTLLDSGRTIDPRSLRVRGSRIYWTNSGKTRSATLR